MEQKFKKIDKQYVLSDSSVNEYGFRLLTSGYQLSEFQKNPIGYYMHRREEGVALKWEDLEIKDDKVMASPVINLCNERGLQTCHEAEHGFLNAASVGHIVVLDYSTDPDLMLPGQTGPTITKWYNKECSLVDIPGNCNALTRLYDAQENEINLVDLNIHPPQLKKIQPVVLKELCAALQLADNSDEHTMISAVQALAAKTEEATLENVLLRNDKHTLQQQLDDLHSTHTKYEIVAMLDRALEDKKITAELRDKLSADYAGKPEALRALLSAMPAYRSILESLKSKSPDATEEQWTWDDYEQKDTTGKKLKELKANYPERYTELFNLKFK